MKINGQMTLDDVDQEYKEFLEKFKPKKTTDDCYTPRNIYNVVLEWAVKEYGIDKTNVVRPFWPGGNYEKYNYPFGCTVVDNPPFSIITKICRDYNAAGIRFFLFAPYLTCFQAAKENDVTFIVTGETITYENGAKVATAFITNLDGQYRARSAPDLSLQIKAADRENTTKGKKEIPKYAYPDNIVTAAMLGYMAKHGVDFRIRKESAEFIKKLDEMTRGGQNKGIFGGAFILSTEAAAEKAAAEKAAAEKAAAEKAAATRWSLSDNEIEIIKLLDGKERRKGNGREERNAGTAPGRHEGIRAAPQGAVP